MIIDSIQNRAFYRQFGFRLGDALDYLAATDFAKMPDGKYELDGQQMFAIVQRYSPKPLAQIVWESHRKYIDVQYIAAGAERMGYIPLNDRISIKQQYDSERDIIFYDTQGDLFTVSAGSFVVFAPQDVHAPGLVLNEPNPVIDVIKVVVKVKI